jgi:hypothetical protein
LLTQKNYFVFIALFFFKRETWEEPDWKSNAIYVFREKNELHPIFQSVFPRLIPNKKKSLVKKNYFFGVATTGKKNRKHW